MAEAREEAALPEFIARIEGELRERGLSRAEAAARLRAGDWWPLLREAGGTVMAACSPAQIAQEVAQPTACRICGHPLHRAVGDVRLPVGGRLRLLRRLPHIAPCSCGYADRALDPAVAEALRRHFGLHPDAQEFDAGDAGFAALVRELGGEAAGPR